MAARYYVHMATELLEGDVEWPDGLRLAEPPVAFTDLRMHCCLLEDDGADEALDGQHVDLGLARVYRKRMFSRKLASRPVITSRHLIDPASVSHA